MDITREDFEYFTRGMAAFVKAGPEGHYSCKSSCPTGLGPNGTRCVNFRLAHSVGLGLGFCKFGDAWREANGEVSTVTNERGYDAVVAGFDKLIAHYAPQFTPDYAPGVVTTTTPILGLA